jgi:hypothetical protein
MGGVFGGKIDKKEKSGVKETASAELRREL